VSFRALIIPEDPTNNGYILRPLITRMLAEVGKPNAQTLVLTNPRLTGYDHAVKAIEEDLPLRYTFYDLWLFLPDADRAAGAPALEARMQARGIPLLCCASKPEVEAWALAGHRDKLNVSWSGLRTHPRFKEDVFEPFLANFGDMRAAGGGREKLMRQGLANYRGLLEVCPELADLQKRLSQFLQR
jgi:hypothetical protein